jgi:type I restriction enzyme S subunit
MKQGWVITKLGDVCDELFAGGDVPKDNSSKMETDIYNIPIFSNGEKNKGLYGYTNVARVTKPSITISARGTIGYSEIRVKPFYPAIRLIVAIPKITILDLSFLKYVIGSNDFTHSGSSIPQLTVPMIKEYPIPLPPLPEQHRIVSILDQAFAAIAKAKANAERCLRLSKALFESYLQGVFENKGEGWEEKTLGEVLIKTETVDPY